MKSVRTFNIVTKKYSIVPNTKHGKEYNHFYFLNYNEKIIVNSTFSSEVWDMENRINHVIPGKFILNHPKERNCHLILKG